MPSALLRINSQSRTGASLSTSHFNVNFNNAPCCQGAKAVILKHISFPNVFYTIRTGVNDTFTYNISGTPTTVTIPTGNYTVTSLIAELETSLNGIGFTATLSSLTSKLSFTTTTAIEWLTYPTNRMANVLGLITGSVTDETDFEGTGIPDLSGIRTVYLTSDKLSDGVNMVDAFLHGITVIGVVPVKVPFGVVQHYDSPHEGIDDVQFVSQGQGINLQYADIKLYDQDANLVDLQGHHVNIIFKLYY
jgi:hypothetical protein